jgi:hypothetical protein
MTGISVLLVGLDAAALIALVVRSHAITPRPTLRGNVSRRIGRTPDSGLRERPICRA